MTIRLVFLLFVAAGALLSGCSQCDRGGGVAPFDAVAAEVRAGKEVPAPVVWKDDSGMLKPSDEVPFGVPVPVNMVKAVSGNTWARYEGTWKVDEVLAFYRKYMILPEGGAPHQKGRAYVNSGAAPAPPGKPGRDVEVWVIDEKEFGRTTVTIYEVSSQKTEKQKDWDAVPPSGPPTWKPSKPGEEPPGNLM